MKSINEHKLATVVLVEDSLADIDYVKAILKRYRVNLNLKICRDGKQILDFLYKRENYIDAIHPDLILLDLGRVIN